MPGFVDVSLQRSQSVSTGALRFAVVGVCPLRCRTRFVYRALFRRHGRSGQLQVVLTPVTALLSVSRGPLVPLAQYLRHSCGRVLVQRRGRIGCCCRSCWRSHLSATPPLQMSCGFNCYEALGSILLCSNHPSTVDKTKRGLSFSDVLRHAIALADALQP